MPRATEYRTHQRALALREEAAAMTPNRTRLSGMLFWAQA
jgi:hypothetical protein